MNKLFHVEIIETLSKSITVIAEDELSAMEMVKKDYKNEDIILDNNHYVTTDFVLDIID